VTSIAGWAVEVAIVAVAVSLIAGRTGKSAVPYGVSPGAELSEAEAVFANKSFVASLLAAISTFCLREPK
jgi:hypothetical protein